ncbi:MAG: prolyl oligopeptidase family serine peptidase [Tannerellaceae bacterium]|nr:prolyl oligopeptidase family serine peptidase [Tannerellaceae bacterium]
MKTKTSLILTLLLALATWSYAGDITIHTFKYAGPVQLNKPVLADSLNVKGKAFETKGLLKTSLPFEHVLNSPVILDTDSTGSITLDIPEKGYMLHLLGFYLNSDRYVKGTLDVTGSGDFEVYVDNKLVTPSSELILEPRRYEVVIKYLTTAADTTRASLKAEYFYKENAGVVATPKSSKRYTLQHILEGKDFRGVSLSANGKYALVKYIQRYKGSKNDLYAQLVNAETGEVVLQENGYLRDARWMPTSNKLYFTRNGLKGIELVTVDPAANMREKVLVENLPQGNFYFTPDEKTLLFSVEEEGPKKATGLVRITEPSDQLPDFRTRNFIWRYTLSTGLFEQLTFGHNSTLINDVSSDSRYLLFTTGKRVYTELPHFRNSLYKLDLHTLEVDTLWEEATYVNRAAFSPDGKELLIAGSGGAFDGIGLSIPDNQLPNSYNGELFIYHLQTHKVRSLTKDFNPSTINAVWSWYDNQIYLLAEDEDYQRIFVCNPATGKIRKLVLNEDVVTAYSLADTAPVLYYYGQSVSNANRLYAYDLKKDKNKLVHDLSAEKLKEIRFGEVHDWDFTSSDGSRIQGRYYLPPNFDPNKKYPLIVYYYGGTSPTNRMLETRYSMHMYAAQGYVVYTLNPSGTTGFGQEFAARHVNAWGLRTADEIIEGTEKFCDTHSFIDKNKIGCIGASYGGFMTQYLQTKTDLFAAAVSHAGISSLSSYWGEGYWGYGYCSVANTGTYPWNNPEFYTSQSPLFNADKINTPLLLLHGKADTNVPVGESTQMFTALRLLGKTVEYIEVEGENHGIMGYNKRIGWQNSIYAWFAKWLKDQPEWWEAIYPDPTL